jgi:hypothetical protein
MGKQNPRRRKKQKVRQDRLKHEKSSVYPKIAFKGGLAHADFKKECRAIIKGFDFNDREQFPDQIAFLLRAIKRYGDRPLDTREGWQYRILIEQHLMDLVFDNVKYKDVGERFSLQNIISFLIVGHEIEVRFSSLNKTLLEGHWVYYSSQNIVVTVGGEKLTIGFTSHAIERVGQRLIEPNPSLRAMHEAINILNCYCHFDAPLDVDGQSLYPLWFSCFEELYTGKIAKSIRPNEKFIDEKTSLLIGYFVAERVDDLVVCKTFLWPAMKRTPEHQAIMRQGDVDLLKRVNQPDCIRRDMKYLAENEDFGMIKTLHDLGVPQVIDIPANTNLAV